MFLSLIGKFIYIIINIIYLYIICFSQLTFPEYIKDQEFKNLMQLMLNKNKEIRYSKFEQISGHIWFKDFDWDALISLDLQPEYFPVFDEKEDKKHEKKPYLEYIKTAANWEMPEHKPKINEQQQKEFDEWIKKF